MLGSRALALVAVALTLAGCADDTPDEAAGCDGVRARAKVAAETGVRLRAEGSADSAQIERSARDYVTSVRSRPECFTAAQRDNAEQVGRSLPTPSSG